jgi:ribosome modulation factor
VLIPKTAAEKEAWLAGWKAAAAGIGRHECLHYSTLEEQKAFGLGWDKRNEDLGTD